MRLQSVNPRPLRLCALCALIFLLALHLPAAEAQRISYGQTKTGYLSSSNEADFYEFTAQAGDRISISMERTSGSLDPDLELQLSPGAFGHVYDTNSGSGNNALIENIRIDNSGTYRIGALRRSGSGNYRLRLTVSSSGSSRSQSSSCGPPPRLSHGDYAVSIAQVGLPVQSDPGNRQGIEYWLQPGETTHIMGGANCVDGSYWYLTGTCFGSGQNVRCTQGWIAEGTHVGYWLAPSRQSTDARRPTACSLDPRLRIGGTVRNPSGPNNNVRSRAGTNSTVVGVLREGETADVLDGPVNADGYTWWRIRRGSMTGWTAEIGDCRYFLVPGSGSSSGSSRSSSSSSGGSLSGGSARSSSAQRISYGQTRTGRLTAANHFDDHYVFRATAGDVISILVYGDGTMLHLYNSSAQLLAELFEGDGTWLQSYRVSQTGDYTIRAVSPLEREVNEYRLTLELESISRANPTPGARAISYGQNRAGTLSDANYFDDYEFRGSAGDVITITMDRRMYSIGNLDPMLRLYDSSGRGLTENDDGGDGNNARINRYRLSRTGRYTIHALRYGSGQAGSYILRLRRDSTQPPTATRRPTRRPTSTPAPERLYDEQAKTGRLNANQNVYFRFRLSRDEFYNFYLTISGSDERPWIDLINCHYTGGGTYPDSTSRRGQWEMLNLQAPCSEEVRIGIFNPSTTGQVRYSLRMDRGRAATATPRPTSTPRPQTISYGQTKTGSLSSSDWYDRYEFRAQAGDLISISMNRTSGGLDPQLDLRSSSGVYLIGNNDRTSANNDALISNYLIADSGAYQIRARRRSGSGNYRLTLSKAEPTATNTPRPTNTPLPTSTPTPESLAFGQTASGNLSASDTADIYTFSAREGEVVTITLDRWSGDLDPELWLRRSGDSVWQIDADSGSGSSALIQDFRIPASDNYEIAARRQSGSGTYRLQLSRAEPTPTPLPIESIQRISYGQTVTGSLDDAAPFQSYRFDAQAGDLITIDMRRVGGKLDPLVWLMDESGERIGLDDDGGEGSNALLSDFRIADAGAYIVQARRYSGEGSFSLSLSARLPTPTPTPVPPPIAYGENVTGSLDDDTPFQQYRFDARAGDVITLDMRNTSGKLDPLLRLWDNEGALLAEDDDGGVGGNALIDSLEIERAGAYIAQAGRYGGDGSYSLALSRQP